MLGRIISSFRKSKRLRKISMELAALLNLSDFSSVFKDREKKDKAIKELITLCMDDDFHVELMRRYAIGVDDLDEIYSNLSLSGAGQWAGGHFVSASSLVYSPTLAYLFKTYRSEKQDNNMWLGVAYRLVEYFKNGETGMISS